MSSDFNDILRQGYLKVKSKNIGAWNRRWVVLKKASSKGQIRLEKYQDEKTASIQREDSKAILLCDVKNVFRLPNDVKKHAFAIMFNDKSCRQFSCDSEMEADEWQQLLENECTNANAAGTHTNVFQNGQELFNVYLLPSPNLDCFGECLLHVSVENLILYDIANSRRELVSWPLTGLRRYGKDNSKFTIEAGRKCSTGEGIFLFNTSESIRIYQKVHSASVAISQAHRLTTKTNDQPPPYSSRVRGGSEHGPSSQNVHTPLQTSYSLPVSENRAPLPLPRDSDIPTMAPPIPNRPRRSMDQNMPDNNNLGATGSTFQVSYKVKSPDNNNTPAAAASMLNGNDDADQELYIYEEKGLNPEFKKFLAGRKEDV